MNGSSNTFELDAWSNLDFNDNWIIRRDNVFSIVVAPLVNQGGTNYTWYLTHQIVLSSIKSGFMDNNIVWCVFYIVFSGLLQGKRVQRVQEYTCTIVVSHVHHSLWKTWQKQDYRRITPRGARTRDQQIKSLSLCAEITDWARGAWWKWRKKAIYWVSRYVPDSPIMEGTWTIFGTGNGQKKIIEKAAFRTAIEIEWFRPRINYRILRKNPQSRLGWRSHKTNIKNAKA